MPEEVIGDLLRIAADLGPDGSVTDPLRHPARASEGTRAFVADVHRRLAGEPGLVVLTGFPILEEPGRTEAVYGALGLLLGPPLRWSALEEGFIARVEAVGRDEKQPGPQDYRLPRELRFHIDTSTDLISLLCVRAAQSGGESRVLSSKKLHNLILDEDPGLLSVLYQPLPCKVPALQVPDGHEAPRWCEIPLFSQVDGHFVAHYGRAYVEQSQAFDDAPRLTQRQVNVLDAVDELAARPGLGLEMTLAPGDLQVVNNLYVMHARGAYHDADPGRGRLLLRMHLAFPGSPALPPAFAPLYGATAAGTYRGGKWRTGKVGERLGTPLDTAAAGGDGHLSGVL